MLIKRVIPCLDVHNGQVTRGVQFGKAEAGELRNVGDPVELAKRYDRQGADEMVFFDITATAHGRKSMIEVIERTAEECFMPITVGGGIPVVASGGAGKLEHLAEVLKFGKADAVLAASIFHFGEYTVGDVKKYLAEQGIPVRLTR